MFAVLAPAVLKMPSPPGSVTALVGGTGRPIEDGELTRIAPQGAEIAQAANAQDSARENAQANAKPADDVPLRRIVAASLLDVLVRGGDRYPGIIRKAEKKPIRVCFQDGDHDLDNQAGNWWLGNLQMEKALAFKAYDYKFIPGHGGHSNKQEAAVLPDAL